MTTKEWIDVARKITMKLPPDILEHPMPFPARLDYATKIIAQELADLFEHAPTHVAIKHVYKDKSVRDTERLDWLDKNEGKEWSIDYGLDLWSDDKGKRSLRDVVDEKMKDNP